MVRMNKPIGPFWRAKTCSTAERTADLRALARAGAPRRDGELHVLVNMAHPYLTQITGSADGLANYLRQCIFDAIAEHKTHIQRGTIHSNTVRFWKDHLLRIPLILDEDDGDHPDDMLTEEDILAER